MFISIFNNKKIRFSVHWSLVFSFLLLGCSTNKKENNPVTIQWKDKKAESIIIPRILLPGIPRDSIEQFLQIQIENANAPMLGEYIITEDAVTFQPLIAFTRGLKYEIRLAGKLISQIEIPAGNADDGAELIAVYPTCDTMPLNLLKIHITFSKPMQEGQAIENITVLKNRKDTIPSIFLDLQPELWNKERTLLTLWLDPGRIKRDLQPNKRLGSPLEEGANYQVIIDRHWRNAEGIALNDTYRKNFVVGSRDSLSPDPERWTIHIPPKGSSQPLKIDMYESLDYVLLTNAVRVVDSKGNVLKGVMETAARETVLGFIPSVLWSAGDYTIEIEPRLEDLAGNNLNRLFDKDLTRKTIGLPKELYKRSFRIQ